MNKKDFPFRVASWSVIDECKEYSTPIFNLEKRRYTLPTVNEEGTFYVLDVPEWVNVIALTPDGEVILVEQYRFGIDEPTLEIPGGMVDPGENPEEAARRELLEETGYVAGSIKNLGRVSANPAIQNNFTWCYLAEDCRYKGADNPDPHEYIELHTIPHERFLGMVADGTIHHAIVVAAVAKWLLLGEK